MGELIFRSIACFFVDLFLISEICKFQCLSVTQQNDIFGSRRELVSAKRAIKLHKWLLGKLVKQSSLRWHYATVSGRGIGRASDAPSCPFLCAFGCGWPNQCLRQTDKSSPWLGVVLQTEAMNGVWAHCWSMVAPMDQRAPPFSDRQVIGSSALRRLSATARYSCRASSYDLSTPTQSKSAIPLEPQFMTPCPLEPPLEPAKQFKMTPNGTPKHLLMDRMHKL